MEILFFIFGVIVLGLGVYLIYDHQNYERIAMETTGKVIGFKVTRSSKGSKMYKPVIESYFGEFTSNYASSSPSYEVGERVDVLYIAGKDPRIKSKMPYIMGIILILFGGIFCLVFFSIFRFTVFHFLSSGFFLCLIAFFVRRKLKDNGIDSLDELKEKISVKQKEDEGANKSIVKDHAVIQDITAKQQHITRFIGPIFAVVGLGTVGLGIYLGIQRYEFLKQAISATGTVIDLQESRSDDGYTYYPVVEYSPSGSFEAITFRHDTGSDPPSYRKGEVVPVLHLPDNPQNAIIDKGIFNWAISIFVIGFGLLFALAGIAVSISFFKRKKRSSQFY